MRSGRARVSVGESEKWTVMQVSRNLMNRTRLALGEAGASNRGSVTVMCAAERTLTETRAVARAIPKRNRQAGAMERSRRAPALRRTGRGTITPRCVRKTSVRGRAVGKLAERGRSGGNEGRRSEVEAAGTRDGAGRVGERVRRERFFGLGAAALGSGVEGIGDAGL